MCLCVRRWVLVGGVVRAVKCSDLVGRWVAFNVLSPSRVCACALMWVCVFVAGACGQGCSCRCDYGCGCVV